MGMQSKNSGAKQNSIKIQEEVMALGIKQIKLVTEKNYTIESFYEAIKDHEFSAGQPKLVKQALALIIVFPEIDRQNQVQIIRGWFKGDEGNKFTIMKAEAAGMENFAKNVALHAITDGWSSMGSVFGKNSKLCEKQCEEVAEELKKMGL